MNNFIYHNPTKLVFGKGQIARLPKLIPAGKRIMLTFGGGSVKRNGVYDQVVAALEGRDLVEFWGIEANPSVETLREAIALGKERKVDFLLAVGGGSVIDGTKLIAAGLLYDGDAWDIVLKGQAGKTVPLATVLTMSATGSEMNSGAVISRYETKEKYAFYGDYPVFSILDPETLYSLPKRQVACGLADTFVHVLEQYMTTPHQSRLMDRWAEGILHTVVEIAPKALADERDYDTMSEYMLSATLALNDMIRMGVTQDWATHMIGHELTALHGLTHGATLAIVINGTLRVLRGQKRGKLLQYGERIWGIAGGSEEERIDRTIAANEAFFRSLGLSTRLSEEGIGEETIAEIERRFTAAGDRFGEAQNVGFWRPASDPIAGCRKNNPRNRGCGDCLSWNAGLFVHPECRNVETAQRIDRDAVFSGLDAFQDDEVGAASEPARGEGLPFQRVALPVAEGSDRRVFGDPHLLLDLEPEDADHRHRVDQVVRNADDKGDAVALPEPDGGLRAFQRHFVDVVLSDAEQFLPGGRAVAGSQALLDELLGSVVGPDSQCLADEFRFGECQGAVGPGYGECRCGGRLRSLRLRPDAGTAGKQQNEGFLHANGTLE